MIAMAAEQPQLVQMIEAGKIDPPEGWPINPMVLEDINDIRVAEKLGMSALEVRRLPLHWYGAAQTLLALEARQNRPKGQG